MQKVTEGISSQVCISLIKEKYAASTASNPQVRNNRLFDLLSLSGLSWKLSTWPVKNKMLNCQEMTESETDRSLVTADIFLEG